MSLKAFTAVITVVNIQISAFRAAVQFLKFLQAIRFQFFIQSNDSPIGRNTALMYIATLKLSKDVYVIMLNATVVY